MPDKYGQLEPGEMEQGIEEGDFYDYIAPLKGLMTKGKGYIAQMIRKGISKKIVDPAKVAKQLEARDRYYTQELRRYQTKPIKETELGGPQPIQPGSGSSK